MTDGTGNAAQEYVDDMARKRGYVLDYHKVMAKYDLDALKAANGLVSAVYLEQRRLDRKMKELIFIVSLTVLRAPRAQIESHIRVPRRAERSAEEILEATEIALPDAGVVAFQGGLAGWTRVVGAEGVEPSLCVDDAGVGKGSTMSGTGFLASDLPRRLCADPKLRTF